MNSKRWIVSWVEEYMGHISRKCEAFSVEWDARSYAEAKCKKEGVHGFVYIAKITETVEPGIPIYKTV